MAEELLDHPYEPVIRRAAGLGRAPTGRDPSAYEQIRVDCDVLVVGGGPSGLAAAAAAAATCARVMLVEDQAGLGGVADSMTAAPFIAPRPLSWS